ncbi:MAG: tetratricopeptide repeat protein, partial [Halobacteriovoraceae bacterium]|nr:tetratricopeptide repeat protein [Halobacteriovoraceae bacterium]
MALSPLIIKYEKALEEDPRSRVFAPLAESYRKVGLLENAFQVLKKGLRYNPDYLLGYLCLAQCYMDKGESSLCYTTLRPLISQNRDNLKLQKLFAQSAYSTENFEEALDTYKYILYLQPKDSESIERVRELESRLSEDVFHTQPTEEVTFDVEDLKVTPESDKILDDWVQLDLSREEESDLEDVEEEEWLVGKPEEVEEFEEESFAPPEPENVTPVITHTLVDLYLKQGYMDKARELLEKILELQPNNQETLERLAELNGVTAVSDIEEEPEQNPEQQDTPD